MCFGYYFILHNFPAPCTPQAPRYSPPPPLIHSGVPIHFYFKIKPCTRHSCRRYCGYTTVTDSDSWVCSTVRLWSLMTWTCLVVYKGHTFPVWDVRFSSHGHYFCTASHDKTARLWTTDHHQPLRIFAGHFSDVDVSLLSLS